MSIERTPSASTPPRTLQTIKWEKGKMSEVVIKKYDSNNNLFQEDTYFDLDKNGTVDKKITKTYSGETPETKIESYAKMKEQEKKLMDSFLYYKPELDDSWMKKDDVDYFRFKRESADDNVKRGKDLLFPEISIRTTEFKEDKIKSVKYDRTYKIDAEEFKKNGTQKYSSSIVYEDLNTDGYCETIEQSDTYAIFDKDGKTIISSLPEIEIVANKPKTNTPSEQETKERKGGGGDVLITQAPKGPVYNEELIDDYGFTFVEQKNESTTKTSERENSKSRRIIWGNMRGDIQQINERTTWIDNRVYCDSVETNNDKSKDYFELRYDYSNKNKSENK